MQNPTSPDSPTGFDLFSIALELQHAQAARLGIAPKNAPVKALIDGHISMQKFVTDLRAVGYELYTDCFGNICIRTVESGNASRALAQAEWDLEQAQIRRSRERKPADQTAPSSGLAAHIERCNREGREY